jgi:hypothetical protein
MGGPSSVIKIGRANATPEREETRRLKQNMIDVTFARIEGILEVARYERPQQIGAV